MFLNKHREKMKTVAIIGASDNPERYANMAMHDLQEHGYEVVLVNPFRSQIEGQSVLDRSMNMTVR